MRPGAVTGSAMLAELPSWATVRETAPLLTYDQAVHVATTILDDLKAGRLTRPFSASVCMSLNTCAAVFEREASGRSQGGPRP